MSVLADLPTTHSSRYRFNLDQVLALALAPFVILVLALVIPVMLLAQGRPIFYIAERMRTPTKTFRLIKLRTMDGSGQEGVLGGHASNRVTPLGRMLRALRVDELPQIWNVLLGDMRFIGPRPPLRRYVEANPDIYARVLSRQPGVTGLATVLFHAREAELLQKCTSPDATDKVYSELCIPRKARLDRFYDRNRSLGLDLLILFWTFSKLTSRRSNGRFGRSRKPSPSSRAWPA